MVISNSNWTECSTIQEQEIITLMVPSSSEDINRAMRGQLKPLCRNYLGRNGGNVIVYVLISFHSRDVFCTLSCLFVPPGFRWFCARLVVHYLAVYSVSGS